MRSKILVTGYSNPDFDASACAIGYAEYLRKSGKDAIVGLFGTPHPEAQFVFSFFKINPPLNAKDLIDEYSDVVLVDASDLNGLDSKLQPSQVVEIIDHRKVNGVSKFPNAKAQIELVGSAATLIAEKFQLNNIDISPSTAALLYSAIISNTINFKANVTTMRDREAAKWLGTKVSIPSGYIRQMFLSKSKLDGSLRKAIERDFASFNFDNHSLGIAQLEIVDVDKFISSRRIEIEEVLRQLKTDQNLELVFLTAIDLEKATNTFVVIDDKTQVLLRQVLDIKFKDNIAKRQGIMMRKTLVPLIKNNIDSH